MEPLTVNVFTTCVPSHGAAALCGWGRVGREYHALLRLKSEHRGERTCAEIVWGIRKLLEESLDGHNGGRHVARCLR